MERKTYAEWREVGRQVNRGEKAVGRDLDGVALFTKDQTKPRQASPRGGYYLNQFSDGTSLFDDMTDEEFLGYTPGDQ